MTSSKTTRENARTIKEGVRKRYAEKARGTASCCVPEAKVCTEESPTIYSLQERESLPETVTSAPLGCGNPVALAELKPGEVVLDLGSGGGIDCFLASQQVGEKGKVIGLDMTAEMVELATNNARKLGTTNVIFLLGEMEDMPLANASVNVIISNCVINLSPDKDAVFQEAFRVLRSGGRLHVSDLVQKGRTKTDGHFDPEAWAACIAGALPEQTYLRKIRKAGFRAVEVQEEVPYPCGGRNDLLSIKVRAIKPR